MLSIILNAQTRWEEYILHPNNNENLKHLKSIEYTQKNRIDKDIQILAKRIISLDKNSIEVAMKLLLSSKSNLDGYLAPYVRENLSTIIKDNAKLYIDSLINVKATKCLAITNTTEKFVDKDIERLEEYRLRKKSLESLPNSYLKELCINNLNRIIKEKSKFIQELKIKKQKISSSVGFPCGTDGCMLYFTRISSIKTLNNVKKASYKVEQHFNGKLDNQKIINIYAKCDKSKTHKLSFDNQKSYQTLGTEWRESSTIGNKKIANDLCMEFYIPKFIDYKTMFTYTNPNKPLIQKNFGRLYRTLLKKALKEKKPEFAGKHIIAQWGCDEGKNECTTGGIIDASTGKATEFPFKYYAHNGSKEIIYKLNSSLIVFAGDFEFKDGRKEKNKVLFYEFKNGEFLFLKSKSYGK